MAKHNVNIGKIKAGLLKHVSFCLHRFINNKDKNMSVGRKMNQEMIQEKSNRDVLPLEGKKVTLSNIFLRKWHPFLIPTEGNYILFLKFSLE